MSEESKSPASKSRYREGPSDYIHRFHAGNVGDVLKHCLLMEWVRRLQAEGPLHVIDTHAGQGMYRLFPTGEWDAGVGRIDAADSTSAPPLVQRWIEAIGDKRTPGKGGLYPGSAALIHTTLQASDRMSLVEIADDPRAKLEAFYAEDPQVEVHGGDGLAVAAAPIADGTRRAVFIDPPYASKGEWTAVAKAVVAVRAADPTAAICVWYPIKSLMRPHALVAAVREIAAGATIDLISTPLREKRKALNGSGLLFLDPPAGLVAEANAALPWLGEALAHPGAQEWSATVRGWRAPAVVPAE